ncbi:hypothetical protein Pcinc_033113 [Petrolisthes cinctipes]|uniref:Uncharacterized protein n=1 Tax=Petrolisthes cinctipes TaxID=88211 RepID=A0AAE1ETA5_PETCI|nr:hypothetical protein Pcinc_033113 [Petrolisthes cinctipes]
MHLSSSHSYLRPILPLSTSLPTPPLILPFLPSSHLPSLYLSPHSTFFPPSFTPHLRPISLSLPHSTSHPPIPTFVPSSLSPHSTFFPPSFTPHLRPISLSPHSTFFPPSFTPHLRPISLSLPTPPSSLPPFFLPSFTLHLRPSRCVCDS